MNRAFHILVAFCLFGPVVHGEEYHWTQGEIETNKIDLLLVFDRSAVEWLNDERSTNAEAYAQAAIADLNAALARTDLDRFFTFRLAGVETLKHSFSGSNPHELVDRISLMRRTSKREGSVFSKIRSRRNRAQADIVVILTDGFISNVYGSSNALKKEDLKPPALDRFKEKAYCFCDISSCSSRATLLHEIGHVMGAGHSADEWEHGLRGPQVFDYSAGYHFCVGSNRYATVMANQVNIESRTFWPRQPFFSSASHTLRIPDAKTGRSVDTGVRIGTATNDNTRTLRETYRYVANFRVAKKMDEIPVDPDAIRLSVVTGGVPVASGSGIFLRTFLSYDIRIEAHAAEPPKVRVEGLPPGLYYSESIGRIWGWPQKTGKYKVKVNAENAMGYKATLAFNMRVKPFGGSGVDFSQMAGFRFIAKRYRPWRRPEGMYYSVPNPLEVKLTSSVSRDLGLSDGDYLDVSFTGRDGTGRVSGVISGVKVSSFVNFVRFGAGGGAGESQERVGCLVSFPPQEGTSFGGYVKWIDFLVTVDENWNIKAMEFFPSKNPVNN